MYVEIKDDKLLSWCENPYSNYEFVDIEYSTFNPEQYSVIEGKLTDISDTEEYKSKVSSREKEAKSFELAKQIEEIDKKRIRAIAEPSLRNEKTGETWLEYYTGQVTALRKELSLL